MRQCPECGLFDGHHEWECYHHSCDEDDWPVHDCGPSEALIRALGHCGQCNRIIGVWNDRLEQPDAEVCACPD